MVGWQANVMREMSYSATIRLGLYNEVKDMIAVLSPRICIQVGKKQTLIHGYS
jgi:hypothetical protein